MANTFNAITSGAGGIATTGDSSGAFSFTKDGGSAEVYIDSSGNVGIGTSSPSSVLDVKASLSQIKNTSTTGTNTVQYWASNTGGNFYIALDNSTGSSFGSAYAAALWHSGNYPMLFATNNTERMRIASDGTITGTKGNLQLISGTAVSASGTSVDFTGIPSWVKRITVMFSGVSTNGTASPLIQLGTSGTPTTSGYAATSTEVYSAASITSSTVGFNIFFNNASYNVSGTYTFNNVSGNIWTGSSVTSAISPSIVTTVSSGAVTLSGTLNMLRITTTNGTDTFDAGTINIMYE